MQTVLLCGWGETTFMADLLHELDHGPAALPDNSSVTLLNTRPGVDILGATAGTSNRVSVVPHGVSLGVSSASSL